jgi:hypothetical protein
MKVEFHRTGERRYAVVVVRDRQPDLTMNPAPGFDPLMPHDMLHFLVEQELGLRRGIFGQIAVGGTAGTFHNAPSEKSNDRHDSRLRRKTARRGKNLLKTGLDDCAQSERATFICLYDWLAHSPDEKLRKRAGEMKMTFDGIIAQMTGDERKKLNKEKLAAIRKRMDELSRRWSRLAINQSMTLEWLNK